MIIAEKIKYTAAKDGSSVFTDIHLFKEGIFWVAYEQSAYAVWLLKQYKPTKKQIKSVGMEIVSVGFPASALTSLTAITGSVEAIDAEAANEDGVENARHIVLRTESALNEADFLEWKNGLETSGNEAVYHAPAASDICSANSASAAVLDKIRTFDLSNATPMECMLFISEIKNLKK
jgi:hypothetical protein